MGYQTASYQPTTSRDRLLVEFLPGALVNPEAFFAARDVRVLEYIPLSKVWLVELKENADLLAIMSDIAGAPGVKFVEQDGLRTAAGNLGDFVEPAPSSPVLSAASTTLGVLFVLAAVGWALRSL